MSKRPPNLKDLDDDILKHLMQAALALDPEARGNLVPHCVQFTLFLPLDPRIHTAVGTGPDTIGDIIWRLELDRWNESNVVFTMEPLEDGRSSGPDSPSPGQTGC